MGVLDKLVLVYEAQGAAKVASETNKAKISADSAAKAYEDLALQSNKLKEQILDLSKELETASYRDKKSINKTLVEKVNLLNASKDELSFSKRKSELANSQFKILSKRQKEGDAAAGQFADKNKKLLNSFLKLGAKIGLATAPIVAFKKLLSGTLEFTGEGQQLNLLGQYAGEDAIKIQTLGNALKRYGGDAASASATMKGLNLAIENARMGDPAMLDAAILYGDADLFSGSGVDGLVTADELLGKISKRMKELSKDKALNFGAKMGLPDAFIMMMRKEGFGEAMARGFKLNIFDQDDITRAVELNKQLIEMKSNYGKLKSEISENIGGPFLEWAIDKANKLTTGATEILNMDDAWKDWEQRPLSGGRSKDSEAIKKGSNALKSTKNPLSYTNSNTIKNSSQTSNQGGNVQITGLTINVPNATDANGIARDMVPALNNWMSRIVTQNNNGAVA